MPTRTPRKPKPPPWHATAEGHAAYLIVRAEAQALCNADGTDRGIESNDTFKTWRHFMLPQLQYRFGHETTCEKIMCEHLERCQPGHGPMAIRPASSVGPDHHGGPWIGRERALEEIAAWQGGVGCGPHGLLAAGVDDGRPPSSEK